MNNKRIRREASTYFVPFFLGSNRLAHSLSVRAFQKYGIVSYVLADHRGLLDFADPACKFFQLSPTRDSSLLCDQLSDLAAHFPYTLPILVPCTETYSKMVEEMREQLECNFVICQADKLFCDSPLVSIP